MPFDYHKIYEERIGDQTFFVEEDRKYKYIRLASEYINTFDGDFDITAYLHDFEYIRAWYPTARLHLVTSSDPYETVSYITGLNIVAKVEKND